MYDCFLYIFLSWLFLVLKLKLLVVCGFETRPYCLPFCDLLGPRNSLLEAFVVCSVTPRKDQICKHKGASHKKRKKKWRCVLFNFCVDMLVVALPQRTPHTHTFDTMCYLLKHAKCLHGLEARRLLPRVLFRGLTYFEREPAARWLVCRNVQEKPTIHNMPPCKSDNHKTHQLRVIGRIWG